MCFFVFKALDGFFLVMLTDGNIIYISEGVTSLLEHLPVSERVCVWFVVWSPFKYCPGIFTFLYHLFIYNRICFSRTWWIRTFWTFFQWGSTEKCIKLCPHTQTLKTSTLITSSVSVQPQSPPDICSAVVF